VSVRTFDLDMVAIWREHSIPADASTLTYALELIERLLDEVGELHHIIDELAAQ
jgi:hypothetical protein